MTAANGKHREGSPEKYGNPPVAWNCAAPVPCHVPIVGFFVCWQKGSQNATLGPVDARSSDARGTIVQVSGGVFLGIRIASTAIDAAVALSVLVATSRRLPLLLRALLACAAVGIVFFLKLPAWRALGLNLFGVIHLAWLDFLVLPPLILLTGLLLERRRQAPWAQTRGALVLVVLCTLVTPAIGAWAMFVEPYRVQLETVRIPLARDPGAKPLRVGVLADIQTAHVTEYEHRAIDRLLALNPDVILIPGDLFHGAAETFQHELPGLRGLVAKLKAPGGVYFVLGDADDEEEAARIVEGTVVRVLINEVHRVEIAGRALTVGGVELNYDSPAARKVIRELEQQPGGADIRVLLTHRPDPVLRLQPNTRVDLVVAGHTHGGQVQLPFIGAPVVLSTVPRKVGGGGHHVLEGRAIYVSRGLGHEGGQAPRIRFLCPPEVTMLEIGGAE